VICQIPAQAGYSYLDMSNLVADLFGAGLSQIPLQRAEIWPITSSELA